MRPIEETRLLVGPAGWSYADWHGTVYPTRKDRSFDALAYLASYFDLIEINSTFYRTPARETCRRWVDRTRFNRDFVFTAKAPQDLTHRARAAGESETADFKRAIEPLHENDRLGAVLVQFPWSFRATPEATSYVRRLCAWLDPLPSVVEVRHGSWETPAARSFFIEAGLSRCGIDQPAVGDSIRPGKGLPTRDRAYLRLHGRNKEKWFSRDAGRDERYDYLYDESELSQWLGVVRDAKASAKNVYVVMNNHFRGQAVVNALQLKAMLSGAPARAPRPLLDAYPAAKARLRPEPGADPSDQRASPGQLDLFHENPERENSGSDHDQ